MPTNHRLGPRTMYVGITVRTYRCLTHAITITQHPANSQANRSIHAAPSSNHLATPFDEVRGVECCQINQVAGTDPLQQSRLLATLVDHLSLYYYS